MACTFHIYVGLSALSNPCRAPFHCSRYSYGGRRPPYRLRNLNRSIFPTQQLSLFHEDTLRETTAAAIVITYLAEQAKNWSCISDLANLPTLMPGEIGHVLHQFHLGITTDCKSRRIDDKSMFYLGEIHKANPVPSPVHLYNDRTSRLLSCCSPKSSGVRPLTWARAERITLRMCRCSNIPMSAVQI